MHEFSRTFRIIAGLMLIGAGLGLIGALIHAEGVMDSAAKVSVLSRSLPPARPAQRPTSGAILVRTTDPQPLLHHVTIRQADPRTGEATRRQAPEQAQ